jgi:hypothetical protein
VTRDAPEEDPVQKLRRITEEKARAMPPGSSGHQTLHRLLQLSDADLIEEMFRRANPNPDRVGCPPREILGELARRERPLTDPAWRHMTQCSRCYAEYRAIHTDFHEARARQRRQQLWVGGVAAAAVVTLAGVGWQLSDRRGTNRAAPQRPTTSTVHTVELDVRAYTSLRGNTATPQQPPLRLPRSRVHLTMLLPVGADTGGYDIQVLDADLRIRAQAAGDARLHNDITTLETTIDLQALSPGAHQLAIRHRGDGWRVFSAVIE